MNGKLTWSIFWVLVGVFVIVVAAMVSIPLVPEVRRLFASAWFFITAGILFLLLGIALLVLSAKGKPRSLLKKFLILTGAAAAGIPVSAALHNAIYGLLIHFFGEGFWDRNGLGDEPFFFILAIIVCPIGFWVGVAGSVVQHIKGGRR
jgi:hypothetical protein